MASATQIPWGRCAKCYTSVVARQPRETDGFPLRHPSGSIVTKASLLLASTVLACTLTSCSPRITSISISNASLSVGPDWTELPVKQPLTADWQNQIVLATVTTKFEANMQPLGLRLADGTLSTPELDAITDDGNHYPLHLQWFRNANILAFENDSIPRGKRFVRIRVRSPRPLVLSEVSWVSYMPQDTRTGYP